VTVNELPFGGARHVLDVETHFCFCFARFSHLATVPPPATTLEPPVRLPIPPERQLYPVTTDYHWPTFNANATNFDGDWSSATGLGYGPFGFGSSIMLEDDQVR
jgi:hypothetical protein